MKNNRTDHEFTWQLKDFAAGEAKLRMSVSISGSGVAGYHRAKLKLPETYARSFLAERIGASTLWQVAFVCVLAMGLGGVWAIAKLGVRLGERDTVGRWFWLSQRFRQTTVELERDLSPGSE